MRGVDRNSDRALVGGQASKGDSVGRVEVLGIEKMFVNDAPRYLQSTGFVLDREGRGIVSVYSSGAIGRLVPEDVIGLIRYVRRHEAEGRAA